jgi:RimJ/RimL family protein N-acetyltransferase
MNEVLQTARLRLREISPADLDFVTEMLAHPEVMPQDNQPGRPALGEFGLVEYSW